MKNILPVLKDYFETELDQWEMFKMETKFGLVYTTFARTPLDSKDEAFDLVQVQTSPETSKVFWRVGVETPPMRGIALHDFDSNVSALNHIGKWVKEGKVVRSVDVMTKEET